VDPKTWLFALFAGLVNVPNSFGNQRQIVVTTFGFTNLQTTLLGCVDGVVEIVTIWSGVEIVSRIPNSRAYVAVLYTVPNLLGVFLTNFLPWKNKVGLLFALWVTGEAFGLASLTFISTCTELGTTKFVLSIAWLASVTAGHTKRVTVNAIMLSAYCIGNAAGPFMWQQQYKPR
jgi:ACS family allantoate permease-like MFS transporter